MKPRLLDLFCGAGGAAAGYARAGFEVVGVDVSAQPNYPFEFIQADALDFLQQEIQIADRVIGGPVWRPRLDYDVIHASPPCQHFTAYKRARPELVDKYPDLIDVTRDLLRASGLPYVIENVEGSPLEDPVVICGSMFDPPMDIRRHRLFETNWPLSSPPWPCRHLLQGEPNRFPGGRSLQRGGPRVKVRATVEVGRWNIPLDVQQAAMGIDWMTLEELSEAIPPTYCEFIGTQLLSVVQQKVAA